MTIVAAASSESAATALFPAPVRCSTPCCPVEFFFAAATAAVADVVVLLI